jgi:hypothetical protein
MDIDSTTTIRSHSGRTRFDVEIGGFTFRSNKAATAEAARTAARKWYERHLSAVDARGLLHFYNVVAVN